LGGLGEATINAQGWRYPARQAVKAAAARRAPVTNFSATLEGGNAGASAGAHGGNPTAHGGNAEAGSASISHGGNPTAYGYGGEGGDAESASAAAAQPAAATGCCYN